MAKKKTIKELLKAKTIEITTGVTIEKSDPIYYNLAELKKQPEPLYRLDIPGYRYYYRIQNNEPIFIHQSLHYKEYMPTSPHLIQWLISKGGEGKAEAEERANYGTLYHAECGQLMINKTIP
jgi:mRNA-degrading endonuclease RelE of RelBE toxin-antitoxin system